MHGAQLKDIAVSGVALALLNQLWLFGGNTHRIAEEQRGLVKAAALLLAALVFLALVVRAARGNENDWMKPTVRAAVASVGLGLALILLFGAVWNRGQFFHDGVRVPQLASLVAVALLAAALSAAAIGAVARSVGGAWGR